MSKSLALCLPPCLLALTTASAQSPVCSGFELVAGPTSSAGDSGLAGLAVVAPDDVWAVGSAATFSGRGTWIQHWNGLAWTQVPSPNGNLPASFLTAAAAVAPNDVWAVGFSTDSTNFETLTLHWNGSAWSVVPSPNPALPGSIFPPSDRLFGVTALAANDVWAVGQTFDFSDSQPLAMHWDGSNWNVVAVPATGNQVVLNGVSATGGNDVWAVGDQSIVGSQTSLVVHWNGSAWSIVPSPNVGPFLNSFQDVAALAPNDVWAVGYQLAVFGFSQVNQTAIMHWDGVAWSAVPSPNVNQRNNQLNAVAGLAGGDVWAVGFWDNGTALLTLTERWDGTQWSIVPSPNGGVSSDDLLGVTAVNATDFFAVGESFDGFQYATLVERLGGEGQANSAAASLTVNGAGAGACPGPRHVDLPFSTTVQFGVSGPPSMPFVLGLGAPNAGVSLGCPGIIGIGTPPLFQDIATVLLFLDPAGASTLNIPLGGLLPGTVLDLQAAVIQPAGCAFVFTSAFAATIR